MSRRSVIVALVLAVALGLPALGRAGHLPAPSGLTCNVVAADIVADWDDVSGATKYSVGVTAGYDTSGDGVADVTVDFDFGTSDRVDGAPISQSDLTIALADLETGFDTTGDGVVDVVLAPVSVDVRVKALHPGRNQGRQDGVFSGPCTVALP